MANVADIVAKLNAKLPPDCIFQYVIHGTIVKLHCVGYQIDDLIHVWNIHFSIFGKCYLKDESANMSTGNPDTHKRLEPLYWAAMDKDSFMAANTGTDIQTIRIISIVSRFVCLPPIDPDLWGLIVKQIRDSAELGEFAVRLAPDCVADYGRQIHAKAILCGYGWRQEFDGSALITWL